MEILAILILGSIWAYREWIHTQQVNMLTDKLMSRNFEEYKELTTPPKTFEPVSKDDTQLYWQEIEETKQ